MLGFNNIFQQFSFKIKIKMPRSYLPKNKGKYEGFLAYDLVKYVRESLSPKAV